MVLFLCTRNCYRNRFAEVLFNSVADRVGLYGGGRPRPCKVPMPTTSLPDPVYGHRNLAGWRAFGYNS